MIRLFAAVLLFSTAALPAFACDWNSAASGDPQSNTVASQPSQNQTAPSSGTTSDRS